jgi:sugar diacid utilization regulator
MATLSSIIQRLEQTFNIHIHGKLMEDILINDVRFLNKEMAGSFISSSETLYVGNYEDLCDEDFSANVLVIGSKTDTLSDQYLYIMQPLNIYAIFNSIQEELRTDKTLTEKKEELFQALRYNYGIQGIINIAYSFFNNSINVCDTSFSILANYPNLHEQENNIFDYKNGKYYLKLHTLQFMKNEKFFDQLSSNTGAFLYQTPNTVENMIFCGIRINRPIIGYVCIRATNRPFEKYDLYLAEVLSQVIGIEMQKSDFLSQKTGLKFEYFLADLINNEVLDTDYILQRMHQLGYYTATYNWILVINYTKGKDHFTTAGYYAEQLMNILPGSIVSTYSGNLVALLTSDGTSPLNEHQSQLLNIFLTYNKMKAGISFPYKDLAKSKAFYAQALNALTYGPYDCADQNIYYYENGMLKSILNFCSSREFLEAAVHPDIRLLAYHDELNHTEFIKTLRTYLEYNRNAVQASAALHIHKSTFFYRISKIADLTGVTIENSAKLLLFEFSFMILDYLNTELKM